MNEPNLEITLSKNTTTQLEKILYEYKTKILYDLSKNLDIPFKTLKQQFLVRDTEFANRYYGPNRTGIKEDKCKARIWHKQLGAVQCSRNISDGDFCKTHYLPEKRRYGRIDEELKLSE